MKITQKPTKRLTAEDEDRYVEAAIEYNRCEDAYKAAYNARPYNREAADIAWDALRKAQTRLAAAS